MNRRSITTSSPLTLISSDTSLSSTSTSPKGTDPTSPIAPISPWPPRPHTRPYDLQHPDTPIQLDDSEFPSAKATTGFIAVCATYTALAMLLVWALIPEPWLKELGMEWLPSQYWTIIVPSYTITVVLLAYLTYAALMAYNTPELTSLSLLTDHKAQIPPPPPFNPTSSSSIQTSEIKRGPPEPYDLPLGMVNRVLYPPRPRRL